MDKAKLKFIFSLTCCMVLVFLTYYSCSAQTFDPLLEKHIKTEINMNRLARSQNPLQLSSFHKKHADSINMVTYISYNENVTEDSRGRQEDWPKIWERVDAEFKKYYAYFNVMVIKDGDYKTELKKQMFDRQSYFYKPENYEISLSAIRHGDKIFLTILTW